MNLLHRLIDLVYPPRCAVCRTLLLQDAHGDEKGCRRVCSTCLAGFHALNQPYCTICGRPFASSTGTGHVCESCLRKRPAFHALGAPYLYEGSLQRAIHSFKYGGRSDLSTFLGPLLSSFARGWAPAEKVSLVMPVPLHPRRLRERGFNQSKLLAWYVARGLGAGLDFLSLRRVRYTQPQTGLGKAERRKNVRKAFALRTTGPVSGRTVLVVDDVATTGNTLNECARVLLKGGAETVLGLVVARTPNPAF